MPRSNQNQAMSSQTTKKQTISWASSMVVKEIEFHQNAKQNWYQKDELMAIRKENREICKTNCFDDDYRGLEAYAEPSFHQSRTLRRREVTLIVQEEQQDQRKQRTYSPDFIAELCEEISILSVKEALVRGLHDEKVAAEIHQEEEKEDDEEEESTKESRAYRSRLSSTYSQLFRKVNPHPKRVIAQSA